MALSDSRKHNWNPREVLGLDPLAANFACVGAAITKGGSRCRWRLDGMTCATADDLLNEMATTYPIEEPVTHQLRRLASLLLCKEYHQYQADRMVREWVEKIRQSRIVQPETLEPEKSDDEMQTALSCPSSASPEAFDTSPISRCCIEEVSIFRNRIISILANDERLKPLYSSALNNPSIGAIQFESNFRRFLEQYAEDLCNEARGPHQKNVAHVFRIHAGDIAIGISSQIDGEDIKCSERIKRCMLEKANSVKLVLFSLYIWSKGTPTSDSRDNRGPFILIFVILTFFNFIIMTLSIHWMLSIILIASVIGITICGATAYFVVKHYCNFYPQYTADDFSNFASSRTQIKQFMIQSNAFNTFRQQLDQFVHLDHDAFSNTSAFAGSYAIDNKRVVKFTPWTKATHPGYIDRIKGTLEKRARSPVIWWPLQPTRTRCPNGYTRISWACACGAELSVDVPEEVAEDYKQKCSSNSTNLPILPLYNNTAHIATSTGTSTQTQATAPSSSGMFQRSSQQPALTSNQNSAAATQYSLNPDRYIHWCVDANRYETQLNHISVPTLDDINFASKLKSAYRATRGVRQWFSLTDCYGVRFVAFERINRSRDLVACGKEDLPCPITNKDYTYSYKDPREQFIKTLEQSLIHSFHSPHSCTVQNLEDIITRIPKKINGRLKKEYGALGYGMHAVPGWAVWKLMVALFLSQLGPLVFFIKWLSGHPGDLQNAFALSMYLIALLNLVVVIPDVWSLQR